MPPLAVRAIRFPAGSVAEGLVIWTAEDVSVVEGETARVTVAITPLLMVFSLIPKSRQLYAPETALQDTDLPAAVAAGPAATLMDVKSTVE